MKFLTTTSRPARATAPILLGCLASLLAVKTCAAESSPGGAAAQSTHEVNFQQAATWWPDLPNIWTPVGWKDDVFRFNVFWNGMILAEPAMNRRTQAWAGQGLQVTVLPTFEGDDDWGSGFLRVDDNMVRQGWNDDAAPVLWSEWTDSGLLLREEVFAHIAGGGAVTRGDEPVFLWIRLSVHAICETLPPPQESGFTLRLQAPNLSARMSIRDNVHLHPEMAKYPRTLTPEAANFDAVKGLRILEPDGKARLAAAPGKDCRQIVFSAPNADRSWPEVHAKLPVQKGAHVDFLLPITPQDRAAFDAELATGYEGALAETRAYWKEITATPTKFEVPEPDINDCMRQSVRFANMLTEKNPATGKYCIVNGSWVYCDLWTTPGAMDLEMLLDTLGHHETVDRYLTIFLDEQGTVKPPGACYPLHPGFLSTPAAYKSVDWLGDNGAVLYTLANHALLSGDKAFIERATDGIVRSCEWIVSARHLTNHNGRLGVLPPAVATDDGREIQAVWSNGWNYKGLCAAVKLLQQIGHPRAAEFAKEAAAYREDFLKAIRSQCKDWPVWKDATGKTRQLVPTDLTSGDQIGYLARHPFYLDGGPLMLVYSGLMDASDPLMQDGCAWFRDGPQRALYRTNSHSSQVAVLDHEISSCEPCYSWNIFHSWQLGDRERFLEGMYSVFAGSVSRKTRISCEHRGGITGNVFSAPLGIYLARLAVIDDQLQPNELHLLRLMPLAWLPPSQPAVFQNIPTEFGPVTVETKLSADGRTLEVTYQPTFRGAAPKVWLHIPPVDGLTTLKVNGKELPLNGTAPIALN